MSTKPPHEVPGFEQLLAPYLEKLYRLAYRLAGQAADAEDLIQDLLVKLYQRRDELSSIEDLGPWLSRVLYNQFVDRQRQFARKRLRVVSGADGSGDDLIANLASPEPGPAVHAQRDFDITQLSAALAQLSVEHRTVLLMHDSEGYKLDEIQRITGIPVGTVKSRLHRARARVRDLLGGMEPFDVERRVLGVEGNKR